jgi:hypothetical protein
VSFLDNAEAFAAVLPANKAPLILDLATFPWPDQSTRDQFIIDLSAHPVLVDQKVLVDP